MSCGGFAIKPGKLCGTVSLLSVLDNWANAVVGVVASLRDFGCYPKDLTANAELIEFVMAKNTILESYEILKICMLIKLRRNINAWEAPTNIDTLLICTIELGATGSEPLCPLCVLWPSKVEHPPTPCASSVLDLLEAALLLQQMP